jgi:hypothetical protein
MVTHRSGLSRCIHDPMKKNLAFLLILLLSACQSSLIADLVTQPGQALYQDDFSDPVDGWVQTSDMNGSLGYFQGAYQIQVNTANHDLWAVSGHEYQDVQLEAVVSSVEGPVFNRFGLICRFQDALDYYFFIISSDGYYAIGRNIHGSISLLGQEMMAFSDAIVQGNAPIHLRFDCIGNTLTGTVDDQVIASANDDSLTKGDAGLLAGTFDLPGVTVVFDDFRVIKP